MLQAKKLLGKASVTVDVNLSEVDYKNKVIEELIMQLNAVGKGGKANSKGGPKDGAGESQVSERCNGYWELGVPRL